MRYAVLSDIHGNLEAFDAVRSALLKERIDAYVSLGDIVGYGADPGAAIRAVRDLGPVVSVAGNHDRCVIGRTALNSFNDCAREALEWTKSVLDPGELSYLRTLQLVATRGDMTFVHGSLEDPESFNYILNPGDAYITIELMKTRVCLVGHSHVAGIFVANAGKMTVVEEPVVRIDQGSRYLVNAGSVGQPRDGDPRSSYVVCDDERGTIEICRVPYDIEKAQRKIRSAGLPAFLAYRLPEGI